MLYQNMSCSTNRCRKYLLAFPLWYHNSVLWCRVPDATISAICHRRLRHHSSQICAKSMDLETALTRHQKVD
eukprot:218254-Rhodomonas_salina.4